MDRSIEYGQVMSNYNSAYNTGTNNLVYHPTIYMPISSSASFSSQQTRSNPKFNLDLYNPNEYSSESFDYPSPSDSVIIHHHPLYSPSPSQAISKLRQVNDELCYTLAQCDLNTQSQSPPPPHYHVHHYPIPRSPSPKEEEEEYLSSTESEPTPKKRNARITYKAHIPRRKNPLDTVDQLLVSTSDVYAPDEAMTIDLYPTRDQGFVRRIRNRPDNQSPWLADTSPIRRNSYSETSTYRTPRAPYYDNKPIEPNSRLANGKNLRPRPRSSSVKSRIHRSADVFSRTAPVWRPSGSIKNPKFMGSHDPPSKPKSSSEPVWNPAHSIKTKPFRALDPVSISVPKTNEPVWHPPSKTKPKPPKYFEPALKPELTVPIEKQTAHLVRKQSTIRSGDPKLKARIANAESKVVTRWDEPPATRTRPKPSIAPRPTTTTTMMKPPKPKPKLKSAPVKKVTPAPPPPALVKTDTGRSSLNDVPSKPMFQSTPRNQSINQDAEDLFEVESQASEPSQKPTIPHPPPQIEITPTKPSKTTVPEPDQGTKATIKDGVLIHGDDIDNRSQSPEVNNNDDEEEPRNDQHSSPPPNPPPPRKAPSPKPDNRDDVSVIDDEDINQSHEDTAGNSAMDDTVKDTDAPSISKADNKTSPHRKEPSSLPQTPDETSRQSSVKSEPKTRQVPSSTPPPASATNDAADDFFDT